MRRALFYTLSALLWGTCLGLVALVWLEYLGGYDLLKGLGKGPRDEFRLHHSSYFGEPLAVDPYEPFSVQNLHPFYLFSLPWTEEGIAKVNNPVVSLNARGFRNSFSNGASRRGVVLGGSAAFGFHASSDRTTLASALNRLQGAYDFENLGVASWNSHQEMVAYTKVPFATGMVVAFTGANDFIVALSYCRDGLDYPAGSPESFEYLAAIADDIRGERKDSGFLSGLFPRTQEKIARQIRKLSGKKTVRPDCTARILEAANAFLANQRVVRDLAVARGGRYLMVLQPHIHFVQAPGKRWVEEAGLRKVFYRHIMESEFCRESACLDLSRLFEGVAPLHISETPDDPNRAVFTDRVHLTDRGFEAVAGQVVRAIGG